MAEGAFPEVVFADVRRRTAELRPPPGYIARTDFGLIFTRNQAL